jgi:hypothetical protein
MSTWKPTSVEETPVLRLSAWVVYELPDGSRHFNGFNMTEGEGRVSSPIVQWDPITRCGVTRSGRVYMLEGASYMNIEASYVWDTWRHIYGIMKYTDVSNEYENQ